MGFDVDTIEQNEIQYRERRGRDDLGGGRDKD